MYFSRYFRLTGAVAVNIAINERIPRICVLWVQSYLRAPELLLEQHLSPSKDEHDDHLIPPANPDISVALKVMLMLLRATRRRRILYNIVQKKKVRVVVAKCRDFIHTHNASAACLVPVFTKRTNAQHLMCWSHTEFRRTAYVASMSRNSSTPSGKVELLLGLFSRNSLCIY